MNQNKKKNSSLFGCFCEQPVDQGQESLQKSNLQSQMKLKQSDSTSNVSRTRMSQIQQSQTSENDPFQQDFSDLINQYESNPELKSSDINHGCGTNKIKQYDDYEEFKTDDNSQRLIHAAGGLLVKITSIYQDQDKRINDSYYSFILKVCHNCKNQYVPLTPQQEVLFVKQLVPQCITEQTLKRAKHDIIIIAHDCTGSLLMKHLALSQAVYIIEDNNAFSHIVEKAVCILNQSNKLHKVLKAEIQEKVDTAIINLYHSNFDYQVSPIVKEYLSLAHDIIVVLSPKMEYHDVISEMKKGIQDSEQSKINCGIEVQNIYIGNQLIARIAYYGEVSKITQNDQLNFLYSCLSQKSKKKFKYKGLFKELRSEIGIMKLAEKFDQFNLFQNQTDQQFELFYKSVKKDHLQPQKSSKYLMDNTEDQKSSTESESEGDPIIFDFFQKQSKSDNVYRSDPKPTILRKVKSCNEDQKKPLIMNDPTQQ